MTTKEVLNLDCRSLENKIKLQSCLLKIPQLKECTLDGRKPITLEMLENYVSLMCRKYSVIVNYITPNYIDSQVDIYCISIKNLKQDSVKFVYANSIYEAYCKISIAIYADFKKGKFEAMNWDKVRKQVRAY
jgi:hypothetical protein